jgi:Alpha/beta hydrolase family
MVLRNSNPKGTALFLHGFPETVYAWKDIAKALADEYEVHAFDWPGYGLSSRPTVDRFSYAPKDYARILDRYFGKAGSGPHAHSLFPPQRGQCLLVGSAFFEIRHPGTGPRPRSGRCISASRISGPSTAPEYLAELSVPRPRCEF